MSKKNKNSFCVFEHQTLKVGHEYDDVIFTEDHRAALELFYGKGVPYYNLIHKGVQFNEQVGVMQVGKLLIEVLPKADRYSKKDEWRNILIDMIKTIGSFDTKAPTQSQLNLKSNFILDMYFELYIKELEYLLHKGLIKKYRKTEGNSSALKGALAFGKHIQNNIVHQERFYIKYTTYDQQHQIHLILYKALLLLKRINNNVHLNSRIGALLLNFQEMPDIKVTDASFERLELNRKSQDYKNALEIARLLLLNYHPDISKGQNDVLALMFDMNMLWEKFIYVCLRKNAHKGYSVKAQSSKYFWQPEKGYRSRIKPDIVITYNNTNYILDTKWKNITGKNPSPDDLRQLYVYHSYYNAQKVALVYPGKEGINKGRYYETKGSEISEKECSVITVKTNKQIKDWQEVIFNKLILNWVGLNEHTLTDN